MRNARVQLESLEMRRLMSASLSFNGPQTITPGPTINVSADNSFGQSGMVMEVNPQNPLQLAGIVQHIGAQNEIDIYRSGDGGTTWAKTAIDNGAVGINDGSDAGMRFDPAIAYDDNGGLYVAYANDTGTSTSIVVGRSSDNGATFSQFRTIATTTDIYNGTAAEIHGNAQPSLATGPDGLGGQALYVAYIKSVIETGVGLDQRVMLDATNSGLGSMLGAVIVNNASVSGADPENVTTDVAVGPNGQVYMVWHNCNIDTGVDRLMFDRDLDGRFVSALNFGNDGVAKNFANGSLVGWPVPAQPEHGVYTDPTLAVDRSGGPNNGRVYLSYVDQTNAANFNDTDIHVQRYNGASWTDATVFASAGSEFDPQVAVDQSSGAVGVAFYSSFASQGSGNASVDARLALSIDGGVNWTAAAVGNTVSNETGGYSGDYSDHMGLAFRDGTAHVFWSARHGAGADLDAFTTTVGLVSSTGGNFANINVPYDGSLYSPYTQVTSSGDYLVVKVNGVTQFAGVATTLDQAIVNGAFADNIISVDAPPGGLLLSINGNVFNDSIYLVSLPAGTPTIISGGGGDDYVGVTTNSGQNLDAIASPVTIYGGDGADHLFVYDSNVTVAKLYTVTSTSVSRANFGGISYYGTEDVLLYAGHGDDQVNVASTSSATTVHVYLGDGDDAIYLGTGNYGALQGPLSVDGGNGAYDAVIVVDNASAASDGYTITSTDIGRDGAAWATYTQIDELYLSAEQGNNHITVTGTAPSCAYHVYGNGGTDLIDVQGTDPSAPVVIEPSAGDDNVNVNTDNAGTAKVVFPYSERIGALSVGNGGLAQLSPGDAGDDHVLTVTSLNFGTGQLDLTNGDMIVDYSGPSPLATAQNYLTSGYFAGGWTGAGINSSAAAANPQRDTALGVGEAAQLGLTHFDGIPVDSTAIVVKYTYYGDANLDGGVDTVDFNLLAANFGNSSSQWGRGDFNFDTLTDTIDFNLLASNFAKTGLGPATASALGQQHESLAAEII